MPTAQNEGAPHAELDDEQQARALALYSDLRRVMRAHTDAITPERALNVVMTAASLLFARTMLDQLHHFSGGRVPGVEFVLQLWRDGEPQIRRSIANAIHELRGELQRAETQKL